MKLSLPISQWLRIPTRAQVAARWRTWWHSDSRFVLISLGGHGIALVTIACLPMAAPELLREEAPAFESRRDETEIAAEFESFEIGDPPLEPTEISNELTLSEPDSVSMEEDAPTEQSVSFVASDTANSSNQSFQETTRIDLSHVTGNGPVAIGSPGGPSGPVGDPRNFLPGGFGPRKQLARTPGTGATKQTEKAVQGGLVWLARHQNPDGSWSLDKHSCKDRLCNCGGEGETKSDAAATAFALLPYLASGQTHLTDGPYKKTIYGGVDWLVRNQKADGNLAAGAAQTMYTHGLASIALCEAYGLSNDKRVGQAAQAAIRFIEQAQDPETGGWWYQPRQKGGDTSVFGWQLMALKSAQMAGLSVNPTALSGAQKWLKTVSKGEKGGLFSYRPESGPTPTMTSVGVLATQYLGAQRNDARVIEGMEHFLKNMPNPKVRNCYYWYYATQVMHNLPGADWDRWNREMRRVLIDSQVKEGCALGSWDPDRPTSDPHGKAGGRVMVTSIATLTLEVYYRFLPLYQLDPVDAATK